MKVLIHYGVSRSEMHLSLLLKDFQSCVCVYVDFTNMKHTHSHFEKVFRTLEVILLFISDDHIFEENLVILSDLKKKNQNLM